ncbi:MAG: hypothetical protein KatS3mg027_0692 [Bacteroidia bacterium]|nr:MAG: hypothetical protein KatS3mg027_0692 [Bacteroidia bacterium]
MLKRWLREWYILSKTQRRGTLVLFVLLVIVLLIKWLYHPLPEKKELYFAQLVIENTVADTSSKTVIKKDSLFFFNPNTIQEDEMKALGFSDKLIRNIINYRNAGGKFHSKESLEKLYAMNDSIYQKIEPYILIDKNETHSFSSENEKRKYSPKSKENYISIELNSADSTQLEQLKGIGKTLSQRIIKYRNRLGGFYSLEQLKEVYGIRDSLYNIITQRNEILIDTSLIKKINLTTADFKTLIRHPYFTKDLVIKILDIQKTKQPFTQEKIKQIMDNDTWDKLKHYLVW